MAASVAGTAQHTKMLLCYQAVVIIPQAGVWRMPPQNCLDHPPQQWGHQLTPMRQPILTLEVGSLL